MIAISPWLRLVLAVLATYRLAHLIGLERGPFDLALRFRLFVQRWYPRTVVYGRATYRSWQAEGVECPLCISFWLAAPAVAAVVWPTTAVDALLLWLGVAGAVLVAHRAVS